MGIEMAVRAQRNSGCVKRIENILCCKGTLGQANKQQPG